MHSGAPDLHEPPLAPRREAMVSGRRMRPPGRWSAWRTRSGDRYFENPNPKPKPKHFSVFFAHAGAPDLHEPPPAPRHEAMVSTQEDAAAWTLERLADAQWAGMAPALRAEPPSPPPPPPPDDPEEGAWARAVDGRMLHTAGLLHACFSEKWRLVASLLHRRSEAVARDEWLLVCDVCAGYKCIHAWPTPLFLSFSCFRSQLCTRCEKYFSFSIYFPSFAGENWQFLVVEDARLGLCEDSHALATLRRWAAQRSHGAPRWGEPVQRHTDGLWLPLRPVHRSHNPLPCANASTGGAGGAFSDLGASKPQ